MQKQKQFNLLFKKLKEQGSKGDCTHSFYNGSLLKLHLVCQATLIRLSIIHNQLQTNSLKESHEKNLFAPYKIFSKKLVAPFY